MGSCLTYTRLVAESRRCLRGPRRSNRSVHRLSSKCPPRRTLTRRVSSAEDGRKFRADPRHGRPHTVRSWPRRGARTSPVGSPGTRRALRSAHQWARDHHQPLRRERPVMRRAHPAALDARRALRIPRDRVRSRRGSMLKGRRPVGHIIGEGGSCQKARRGASGAVRNRRRPLRTAHRPMRNAGRAVRSPPRALRNALPAMRNSRRAMRNALQLVRRSHRRGRKSRMEIGTARGLWSKSVPDCTIARDPPRIPRRQHRSPPKEWR